MKHEDYYHRLRAKIISWYHNNGKNSLWIKYLLLAPDFFHLLCKLSIDERVSSNAKLKIGFAISYFIIPTDLIPDFLVSVGFLDDIVVASYVFKEILDDTKPEILNSYWAAKRDIIDVIEDINKAADKIVGKSILKKIKALMGDNG